MSSPERAILSSQAALAALKRPQLVALAKSHGLKGSGKNVELVDRLLEHGRQLAAQQLEQTLAITGEDAADESRREHQVDATSTDTASPNIEPLSARSHEKKPEQLQEQQDMSLDAVDEPKEAEEVTPVAQQEPEHVAVSESSAASEAVFTPVEDVSSNASTTIEEAQEEMQEIRLVTPAPTPAATHASSARVATDAPSPARAFVFGAPASPQPKQAQTPAKEDAPVQDAATFAFTFASPMRLTTRLADNFAPTQQQAPTSSTSSHAAVFEEMQRRIGLGAPSDHAGGNTHGEISLFSLGGTSHAGDFSFGAPQPSSAPRFGNAHEREFARMDSITTHYAARRRALEAQASAKSGAGVPHTSTPNARAHANRRSRGNLAAKSSPSGKFRNKPRAFGTSSSSSTATTGADRPLFSPIKPALTSSVSSSALSRPLNELAACSDGTLKRSASAKSASLAASLSKFHQAGAGGGSASSRMASALKDGGWAGGSGSTAASSRGKHATSSKSTVTGSSRGAAVASGSTSEFGALKRPVNDRKPSTASTNGKARKSTGFVRGTRRKSMTIGRQRPSAAGIGKRKSTVPVPPVPKLPNKLSSSVASTSKAGDKRASTEASKPAKSAFARAFGGSTRERPAVASTATAKPTTSSSGPAWKKFDLKESLRRPLGYKPKLGRLPPTAPAGALARSDSHRSTSTSAVRPATSTSSENETTLEIASSEQPESGSNNTFAEIRPLQIRKAPLIKASTDSPRSKQGGKKLSSISVSMRQSSQIKATQAHALEGKARQAFRSGALNATKPTTTS